MRNLKNRHRSFPGTAIQSIHARVATSDSKSCMSDLTRKRSKWTPTRDTPKPSSSTTGDSKKRKKEEIGTFANTVMVAARRALSIAHDGLAENMTQYQQCFVHLCGVAEAQSGEGALDEMDIVALCELYQDNKKVDQKVRDHLHQVGKTLLFIESLQMFANDNKL